MSIELIAYNIKYFREKKHLTQESLAKIIVTSRSNIAKWESNTAVPDIESLLKLSDVFGVSIEQLLGRLSNRENLLLDFKRAYSSEPEEFDKEVIALMEYTMRFPELKANLLRLKALSHKNQEAVHEILSSIITQFEK